MPNLAARLANSRARRSKQIALSASLGARTLGGGRHVLEDHAPVFDIPLADAPRGWALTTLRLRKGADERPPPLLHTRTESNPVNPGKERYSRDSRGFHRVLYLPDDLIELSLELPGPTGEIEIIEFSMAHIGRSRAMAQMALTQLRGLFRSTSDLRDTARRAWKHVRNGGLSELRRQFVARYRAVTDERGAIVADHTIGYDEWRRAYSEPREHHLESLTAKLQDVGDPPSFSVLVPTYNTDPEWLNRCIDSVLGQSYPYWRLHLVDDASTDDESIAAVRRAGGRDVRIDLHWRRTNGHISAASQTALDEATEDWVVLLDHDDELVPFALATLALAIDEHPDAQVLYTDEDKIDVEGRHYDPHFKPPFNLELLRAQNYFGHILCAKRSLVHEVGGFREGFEGSQDYDLVLRLVDAVPPSQIVHVPHILYHWRAIEGSTARATHEKSYVETAAMKALSEHLARRSISGSVKIGTLPTTYRIDYELQRRPTVSIIVPTRDQADLLRRCVETVRGRTDYDNHELVIVDNQSSEPDAIDYLESLRQLDSVTVLTYDEPFNYAAINNFAVANSTGEVVVLLNNDTEVIASDWLTEMVSVLALDDVGVVGAKLRYTDGTIQHGGAILGVGGVAGHSHKGSPTDSPGYFSRLCLRHEIGAVTGACLATTRALWNHVGGLDEVNLAVAFNDIDYCLKIAQTGMKVVWSPWAELYHHESKSRGDEDTPQKKARFQREVETMRDRWGPELLSDPSMSPNLSLDHERFLIADVPRVPRPWSWT